MKVMIQRITEQEEWVHFKVVKGKDAWNESVKQVAELNSEVKGKYRAICKCGFLTYIYCSEFYISI